jgi:hypothetical protein
MWAAIILPITTLITLHFFILITIAAPSSGTAVSIPTAMDGEAAIIRKKKQNFTKNQPGPGFELSGFQQRK